MKLLAPGGKEAALFLLVPIPRRAADVFGPVVGQSVGQSVRVRMADSGFVLNPGSAEGDAWGARAFAF